MNLAFPPEYQSVLASLAHEPPRVQAMFKYAVAALLIADHKAEVVETREIPEGTMLLVRTVEGEDITVLRPPMSEEVEVELIAGVMEMLEEEGDI